MALLPDHVDPMLAKIGRPFDSDHHLFEVKWDGTRAIALIDGGAYRMHNRKRRDMRMRYPELAFLAGLEPGLVLDGEVVILGGDGKPAFRGMLQREQARDARRAAVLARQLPANYVVFDVLYRGHASLLDLPLVERRKHLAELVAGAKEPRLVLSEGVVGHGVEFFEQIKRLAMEGMVAKDLRSSYRPGARTEAWQKIKPTLHMQCVIIGYQLRERELRSLIVAAQVDGALRCVGRVGSGLTAELCDRLLPELRRRHRERPLVECDVQGVWVEPGLYCLVSYFELSATGLRAPVLKELMVDGSA